MLSYEASHYFLDYENSKETEIKLKPVEWSDSFAYSYKEEVTSACFSLSNLSFTGNFLNRKQYKYVVIDPDIWV